MPEEKLIATPRSMNWLQRKLRGVALKDGITIVKSSGKSLRYMFIVTSNSYKDREGEYLTTEALKSYVDSCWVTEDKFMSDNPLLLWHDKSKAIGDIVWADMQGPFLLEVARERRGTIQHKGKDVRIATIWDYLEHPQEAWGASHEFAYPVEEKGLYKHIRKTETSVLPLRQAANAITYSGVIR